MPGDNMIGEYTSAEIAAMQPDEFNAAKDRGFKRPVTAEDVAAAYAAARELPEHVTGRPAAAGIAVGSSVTLPAPQPVVPSRSAWAQAKASRGKDFTTPSGQVCKMQPLRPEMLLAEGILDKVTRLEGLADELVKRAEGTPPEKQKMPSKEDFQELLDLVNTVVPLAVVEPKVYRDDEELPPDAPGDIIRVSDIDLEDRMAILNEALSGIKAFDNFRPAG